ncbi:MAG: PDZ domain-containing protein [Armatimonadetes bacterium]|nr:MAG: PDZ domain-containing protein [Armatimonadota bacterium]
MKRLLRILCLVGVLAGLMPVASAQPISAESKAKVLEAIGRQIKTNAYVQGVDFSQWDKLVEKFKEEFDKAETQDAFATVVNRAFAEFKLSHLHLQTPRAAQIRTTGKTVGIGVTIQQQPDGLLVTRVIEGGPAEKAGIKVGDVLIEADGKPIRGPEDLRGDEGTKVRVKVRRGEETPEFEITRAEFSVLQKDDIKWIDDKTAIITVHTFATGYDPKRIDELFREAKKAERLILDLRSNGGGAVPNLSHLAGKVLPPYTPLGKFITRRDANRYKEEHPDGSDDPVSVAKEYGWTIGARSQSEKDRFTGELVVLVSPASASASEIFAAAIKDHKRGKIVGTKTAGAVLASTFINLPEGFSLQLPLMEFVTYGGVRLEGVGVEPDEALKPNEVGNDELAVRAALKVFGVASSGGVAA